MTSVRIFYFIFTRATLC